MKVDAPLRVQVPAAGADSPSWGRVGLIAVVGFVIGVGWPRLVGAKLGPSVPSDTSSASAAARQEATGSPSSAAAGPSTGAPVAATPPAPSASAPPVAAAMPVLTVNHGVLLSCKSEEGETLKGVSACGGLAGFDAIAQPRLRKLSTCPAASASTSGKLSVVFNLDFTSHHVAADVGKSSTVADPQGFAACVKGAFQGVSLGALDHQNPRYSIAYNVQFAPTSSPATSTPSGPADGVPVSAVTPSSPAPPPASAPAGKSDESGAEVAWEVAIVRDAPRTGAVVARLPRGTKVHVGTSQEGWYKIGYAAGTAGSAGSEGWVYRGAIGK